MYLFNRILFYVVLLGSPVITMAGQHALLIGVSDYSDSRIPDLEGPVHDVTAMRDVLVNKWQFNESDITLLLDSQATEVAILDAIDSLQFQTAEGDDIVIYYSGHGTSARDQDLGARLNLPDGSGAIVGSDFNPDRLNRKSLSSSRTDGLIVGRFDIRPRLELLDTNRNVLVIFDACFAGNAARDITPVYRPATTRQIALSQWLAPLPKTMNTSASDTSASSELLATRSRSRSLANTSDDSFAYKNTVFFGAAAEDQYAVDFSAADIEAGNVATIDGKPHGGFTDSLLRALWSPPDASGALSFTTLFNRTVNQFNIWCKVCGHTPVSLPAASDTNNELMVRTILSVSQLLASDYNYDASNEPAFSDALIVDTELPDGTVLALKNLLPRNALELQSLDQAVSPDLYFEKEGLDIRAYASDGQLITRLPQQMEDATLARWLAGRQWLKERMLQDLQNEQGNLQVSFRHPMASNIVSEGDYVHFSVVSKTPASLVVLLLDASSQLSLLYPVNEQERQSVLPALATQRIPAQQEQPIQVTPPWGTDTVLFYTLPPSHKLERTLTQLANLDTIPFDHPFLASLFQMLEHEESTYSAATIRIVSTPAL